MEGRGSPYASPVFRELTGDALRPGGLELTRRALAFLDLPAGARVLDVGCGPGATLGLLRDAGFRAVGLDLRPDFLAEARHRVPGTGLIQGKGEKLPLADGVVDAVFCECVLSLSADPSTFLRECGRVLVPGGWLVASDLYDRGVEMPVVGNRGAGTGVANQGESLVPPRSCMEGMMSRPLLHRILAEAGFSVRLWEDHTDALKRLVAGLILAYGSLEPFFPAMAEEGGSCGVCGWKGGYFLSITKTGSR